MSESTVLFHFAFQPASRAARLALGEARIEWTDTPVRPWEDDCPVNDFNPSGLPPVVHTTARGRPPTPCDLPPPPRRGRGPAAGRAVPGASPPEKPPPSCCMRGWKTPSSNWPPPSPAPC